MIPGFTTLHRMIFWELLRVFTLALLGLTGLFLIGGLIQQASQIGLSPAQILQIIPLLIPSTLPYTIPATTLFASCVVYGRVSTDNEIVAMKAAGVDVLTILFPAFLLGTLAMVATAGISYSLIPRTQVLLQEEVLKDPEAVLYSMLKRERCLRELKSPYSLYVRDVQGLRLIDVVIKRKSGVRIVEGLGPQSEYDYVARTREARLVVDAEKKTLRIDASRWAVADKGVFAESEGTQPIEIDLQEWFSGKQIGTRPMALDWDVLYYRVAELDNNRLELGEKKIEAQHAAENDPNPNHAKLHGYHVQDYDNKINDATRNLRGAQYEFHIRPALSASCLIFALIGCPVGIWFNRSDYLSTFVICFLPTVLTYFPLLLSGGGMAKDGKVPMIVGVWGANAIVGTLAVVLIFRLIKR